MRLPVVLLLSCVCVVTASLAVVFAMTSDTDDEWEAPSEELEARQREQPAELPKQPREEAATQTPRAEPTPQPTVDGDGSDSKDEDPTKKVCPAQTADFPSAYFADSVLIRLPQGVTEDVFVEFTPAFARISAPVESVSCIEGMPGGMISYMAMTFFQDDTTKDLATLRDETLEVMGYAGAKISDEKRDDKLRFYQAVLDVEASAEKPKPGRALLQMRAANGRMYVIVFESHPDSWNALKETFYGSAAKMSFPNLG